MTGPSAAHPELMPHGYTHRTTRNGDVVTKAYQGPASFYASYGKRPDWPQRHEAIMRRCAEVREICENWEPGGASARAWAERIEIARRWRE